MSTETLLWIALAGIIGVPLLTVIIAVGLFWLLRRLGWQIGK